MHKAPSTHDDEEVEAFYEDVEKAIADFNAKLRKREEESEVSIGNFSFDQRNERGERSVT